MKDLLKIMAQCLALVLIASIIVSALTVLLFHIAEGSWP